MEETKQSAELRRDLNVCAPCAHFRDDEDQTPYCTKFQDWPDVVVQECGGPY